MSNSRQNRIEKLEASLGSADECTGAISIIRYGPEDDEMVHAARIKADLSRQHLVIWNIITPQGQETSRS